MDRNTLVVADLHVPFHHKDYLPFCKRIHKAFKCTRVVFIGDIVDNNAISYHDHDPDGWSPADEMGEADKHLKDWFKTFPKAYVCRGNHDSLVDRKGKTMGLPRRCFKPFREMWKLPKGWVDDFAFRLDDVIYEHGAKYGQYMYIRAAIDNFMSTVTGHSHSSAGVGWIANERNLFFGMGVGCGIDRHKYAFAYGRAMKRKPIVGCGIVSNTTHGVNAMFIPMEMRR